MANVLTDTSGWMTVQEFLIVHPEFCEAAATQVEAQLLLARPRVAGEWGDNRKAAHGYMTAHMLATSPMGAQARLDPKADPMKTTYIAAFKELREETFLGVEIT